MEVQLESKAWRWLRQQEMYEQVMTRVCYLWTSLAMFVKNTKAEEYCITQAHIYRTWLLSHVATSRARAAAASSYIWSLCISLHQAHRWGGLLLQKLTIRKCQFNQPTQPTLWYQGRVFVIVCLNLLQYQMCYKALFSNYNLRRAISSPYSSSVPHLVSVC